MSFGYTLSSEEHAPTDLVRNARRAEEAGFDFVSISDHFHPWVSTQGHGQLSRDLPTPTHFEEVAAMVTEDDAVAHVPCGPETGPIVESARAYLDAGYDHLYFHQIGPDQEGLLRFWADELAPALN